MVVWAIVGPRNILNVSSGIFMRQDEAVAEVVAMRLRAFTFDEGGN